MPHVYFFSATTMHHGSLCHIVACQSDVASMGIMYERGFTPTAPSYMQVSALSLDFFSKPLSEYRILLPGYCSSNGTWTPYIP
jgi:hypothetical protein